MSHNMMTYKEFDERYTEETFKELSLEKWKRLDLRYLIMLSHGFTFELMSDLTCGHCKKYSCDCTACNLNMGLTKGIDKGCSNRAHVWREFIRALHTGNLAEACDYQFQMIKLIEDDINGRLL